MARGRVNATPDCPPYQGALPDRYGDWGSNGLNIQTSTHLEKAGPMARPDKQPQLYRPPVGQFIPQSGVGTIENRFEYRTYHKGQEVRPPFMKLGGSSPMRERRSFAKTFSAHPEYKPDPWDLKKKDASKAIFDDKAKMASTTPFKPTRADLSYRTTKGVTPAFGTIYTGSVVFRPSNLNRKR